MNRNILCILVLLAFVLSSCASDVGSEINEEKKIPVSEINSNCEKVYDYVSEKYPKRFYLSDSVHINSVEKLYNLKLRQCSDYSSHFPEIYEALFGSSFENDSGFKDLNSLPNYSEHLEEKLPFCNDDYSLIEGVFYRDYSTANSILDYATSLNVGKSGFLYYEKDYDYTGSAEDKEIYLCNTDLPDTKYKMMNGEQYSIRSACDYAECTISKLWDSFDPEFVHRPKSITAEKCDDGRYYYHIDFLKFYKDIPFVDMALRKSDMVGERIKAMHYQAIMYSADTITELDAPYGFEKIVSANEITDKIIPLTYAFDILDKQLAPNMELNISDIKMIYYTEYDSSDAEAAEKLEKNNEKMTKHERLACGFPELVENREYLCYPVWLFVLEEKAPENERFDTQSTRKKCIFINAQTGELVDFLDNRTANY